MAGHLQAAGKAAEGRRRPRRWRDPQGNRTARSVPECASPLALLTRDILKERGGFFQGEADEGGHVC